MGTFVHSIRVRYNECDAQGAVFNANYLVYFDVTLTELWREAFGSYDEALARYGLDLVVAEAHVRYLKPARFDDVLEVGLSLERIGTTSITERYEVRRGTELVAEGRMRHVFVRDGGAHPLPHEMRRMLERYLV